VSDKPPSGAGRDSGRLASAVRMTGKRRGLGLGFDDEQFLSEVF
jgi:hypothetical protein